MTDRDTPIDEVMPGVTMTIAESDMILSAVCIALVAPMEGDDRSPYLVLVHTPGTNWITQRGMLHAALDIERGLGNLGLADEEDA